MASKCFAERTSLAGASPEIRAMLTFCSNSPTLLRRRRGDGWHRLASNLTHRRLGTVGPDRSVLADDHQRPRCALGMEAPPP